MRKKLIICIIILVGMLSSCSKHIRNTDYVEVPDQTTQYTHDIEMPKVKELEKIPSRSISSAFTILGKDAIFSTPHSEVWKDQGITLYSGKDFDNPAYAIYKFGPFPENDAPVNGSISIYGLASNIYIGYADFSKSIWRWTEPKKSGLYLDFSMSELSLSPTRYSYVIVLIPSSVALIESLTINRLSDNPVNWSRITFQRNSLDDILLSPNIESVNNKPAFSYIVKNSINPTLNYYQALVSNPKQLSDWSNSVIDDLPNIYNINPSIKDINGYPACCYLYKNTGLQFAYSKTKTPRDKTDWVKHSLGFITEYDIFGVQSQQFELANINNQPAIFVISNNKNFYLLSSDSVTPKSIDNWTVNYIASDVENFTTIKNVKHPAVVFTKMNSKSNGIYYSQSSIDEKSHIISWSNTYLIDEDQDKHQLAATSVGNQIYICYNKYDTDGQYVFYAYSKNLSPTSKIDWTLGKIETEINSNSNDYSFTLSDQDNLPLIGLLRYSDLHLLTAKSSIPSPTKPSDWTLNDVTNSLNISTGTIINPLTLIMNEINGFTVAVTIDNYSYMSYLYQWEPKTN